MKKALKITAAILLLAFLLLINLSPIANDYFPHNYPYRYCANKCSFYASELGKHRDPLGRVESLLEDYKKENNQPNLKLYRRFKRDWSQIWNWYDFLTHRRWDYPYVSRDEDAI